MDIAVCFSAALCQITLTVVSPHNVPVKLHWEIKSGEVTAQVIQLYLKERARASCFSTLAKDYHIEVLHGNSKRLYLQLKR